MKKLGLTVLALLAGVLTASSAFAWGRSHVFVGFNFGFPGYYPAPYYYYPPPVYYAPQPVVIQQQPQVYVEQPQPQAAPAPSQSNYWYYCAGSRTYYPYVKECPGGWQRVSPTPQG
jgi:hypothetical protein